MWGALVPILVVRNRASYGLRAARVLKLCTRPARGALASRLHARAGAMGPATEQVAAVQGIPKRVGYGYMMLSAPKRKNWEGPR